jgi:regulator of sigma E protease
VIGLIHSLITIVLFFAILGILVIIHELGHFVTARLANVRVLEFGVGFPPRARVLRSKGETLYTLNWLPIGGFVKLEGEDGDEGSDPRSFSSQRLPIKLWILVAGVLMNVLLAFVIFTGIALLATPYVGVTIPSIQPDSPAATAGLVGGDAILAVNGDRYEFNGTTNALDDLRQRIGTTVVLTILHADGSRSEVSVPLRTQAQIDDKHGPLGVSASAAAPFQNVFYGEYTGHDPATAVQMGATQTSAALGLIVDGLGSLVHSFATDPTAPPPVSGPVGIATQLGDIFWNAGPIMTLFVAGILSANLAVVNVLPFPPLDGGRMLMIVLKRLFGARISLRAEQLTYMVGFVFLFAFLIWVTGFDIVRSLGGLGT